MLEKMTTNPETELATFPKQMDKAKANAVAALWISLPFFNECGIFYGDGFTTT